MSKHTIIIAEAGVNHNGDLNLAKQLVDEAVKAGVDYIKFQSFKAEKLVSPDAKKANYQIVNINDGDNSQFAMLKKLELSNENHLELISYCQERGVKFFSTAFDIDGVNYLNQLSLPLFKIPSGEITNFPYLRAVALCGKPTIMSTGMCTEDEIEQAISVLLKYGLAKNQISILHCNTEYPTPMKDVNLMAMLSIKEKFGVNVGYSDHTLGIEVPIAAVALGATIIEKHFTLNRNLPGPDHVASLEPDELKSMVQAIRNIELATSGNGIKEPSESEMKNIDIARKSIHIANDLSNGHIITESDLIALRPGGGISPMAWESIIGKRLSVNKLKFDKLNLSDIQ
jgi:N-acetylneuraminate synthase/N,N'-diacetyllegionaminate synthase